MTVTREQYLGALDCSEDSRTSECSEAKKVDDSKLKNALSRAYEQRTFEIEHYWKRATFFWGFQAAIFVAFGFVWKEPAGPTQSGLLVLSLSSLGILTALANYLSARGSKFWQENWEKHIDMLEDAFEGRLYKTVWLSDGVREYSVSKVNLTLSSYFILFWLIVAGYSAARFVDLHLSGIIALLALKRAVTTQWFYVIAFFILVLLGAIILLAQTSGLKGTIPTCTGERGKKPAVLSRAFARLRRQVEPSNRQTILLRRDAPSEKSLDG
ncbi:RipA family octameric membrane protein [Bradyrhizobium sp. HKCCYLR20261]|uniref:RipA family octameric membrane protein n=1 Tax=Bradyrhizobium sp. HKCCYLR20261 TaxID=3420760 RepID=UPI003EBA5D30